MPYICSEISKKIEEKTKEKLVTFQIRGEINGDR